LPDEHALALADEESPFYVLGGFDVVAAVPADEDTILQRFRTGAGLGWHEHDERLYSGTERPFRPGYRAHLVSEWIPALDGAEEKLQQGARVADVGCGHGSSTIILAEAAQAGEARITEVGRERGFSRVRRVAETPFNMVLEARP
jgi:hypothetical protein